MRVAFSECFHASVFFACGVRFCLRLRVRLVNRLVLLMLQLMRLLPWLLLRRWSMSFMRMRLRVLLRLLPLPRPRLLLLLLFCVVGSTDGR